MAAATATAQPSREVAITIDDLPAAGPESCEIAAIQRLTKELLAPFRAQHIPLIGFVNEGRCRMSAGDLRQLLDLWLDSGAEIGNHTFSHPDLNKIPLARYESDIEKGEPVTRAALAARGRPLRYFRHPFLHTGVNLQTRRDLERYLVAHGYQVAPVTLDNSDYVFAKAYRDALNRGDQALAERVKQAYVPYMESIFAFFEQRSIEVIGHEIPQSLLIHANSLNATMMPALLTMMRSRGYSFVSLEKALQDPAYSLLDAYAGPNGFSWIHRWSRTKGMPPKGEPDEPAWLAPKP